MGVLPNRKELHVN